MNFILHQNDLPSDLKIEGDLAIDTEAMGLNNHRDRLCLLQLSNGNGEVHLVQFNKNYDAPNLKKLLSNKNTLKIMHFARFDVAIIYKYLEILLEPIYCTKIASRLTRTYTDQHSLKELCREILGVNISKAQQSTDWGSKNLSREQLAYAATDVLYLHQLRDKLNEILVREDRVNIAQKAFDFLPYRAVLDIMGWNEDIFAY